MIKRSEKYLSSGTPDITIPYDTAIYDALRQRNPALTEDECEIITTANRFYRLLLKYNGFMLHSSAVAVDGQAYLFSAPSGTGKSTHTEQWLKLFGERAAIINDDKPAIRITKNGIIACGTPWSGKSDLNVNTSLPIKGICILHRAEQNHISRMDEGEAIFSLLDQTIRPAGEGAMDRLLQLIDQVITNVPVWQMGCNISVKAAELAYNAMSM